MPFHTQVDGSDELAMMRIERHLLSATARAKQPGQPASCIAFQPPLRGMGIQKQYVVLLRRLARLGYQVPFTIDVRNVCMGTRHCDATLRCQRPRV